MTDYDGHAGDYQAAKRKPWRTFMEQTSALAVIGNVRGASVIDLACGEGYYTRLLKRQGAKSVLGVDLSADMVALARRQELQQPLGIEYLCAKVTTVPDVSGNDLGAVQPVDLVFAAYLFNHAPSRDDLLDQFLAVKRLLKPGGRLVAVNSDPSDPGDDAEATRPYGYIKSVDRPQVEGSAVRYRFLLDGGETMEITNFFISRAVMQEQMEAAGLCNVQWIKPQVSAMGIERFGAEYWQVIEAQPPFCLIEAQG